MRNINGYYKSIMDDKLLFNEVFAKNIKEEVYELNKPDEALYIDPYIWRSSFEHSPDAVLLVLSSLEYNEEDYIRDYDKFMEVVKCI